MRDTLAGHTIAILGGGQLGRMMMLAGYRMGLRFRVLDPSPNAPAGGLGHHVMGGFGDRECLDRLVEGADLVIYEFENAPAEAAAYLSETLPLHPGAEVLAIAQERAREKELFDRLGISTHPWRAVGSEEELGQAAEELKLPLVAKTRRLGYDGKGQKVLRTEEDVRACWDELGQAPLLVERLLDFDRELSVIGVRGLNGETRTWPAAENHHQTGILAWTLAPAPGLSAPLARRAADYVVRIMEELDYVGVMALELFQVGGELYANEMASRVHNTGHWTIEGAETSQFENHIRAVLGLPLGATEARGVATMVNVIGELPVAAPFFEPGNVHIHLYDKEPRRGRKLGHVTALHRTEDQARSWLDRPEIRRLIENAHT